jgi:DNA repair protein RadC
MKANQKNRSPQSQKDLTLDLFSTPIDTPAETDAASRGDGAQPEAQREAQPEAEGHQAVPEFSTELPALEDIVVHRTEPFRVPGLKGLVLPCPVFSLKLVREKDHLTKMVQSAADAARLCSELLDGYDREVFLVIALSTANRIIGAHVAHIGTVDASIASPREVFKFCLLVNARSVICAHNHPSGNLEPSSADVSVSKQLKSAGDIMGVRLLDSLVIGHPNGKVPTYTSLAERGLI